MYFLYFLLTLSFKKFIHNNSAENSKFIKDKIYLTVSYIPNYSNRRIERDIIIALYKNTPITNKNFLEFIKGTIIDKHKYSYKGTPFHRIIKGFMIQGGNIKKKNGSGSLSIYNSTVFKDEHFFNLHKEGVLSMANYGPNTNGTQFFITTGLTDWLNGYHVVFGEVVDDTYKYVKEINLIETDNNDAPINDVFVVDCGLVSERVMSKNRLMRKHRFMKEDRVIENYERELEGISSLDDIIDSDKTNDFDREIL